MQTRTEKELLELMLAKKQLITAGLCALNNELFNRRLITDIEYELIQRYVKGNRPSPFSSLSALRCSNSLWYWPRGKVTPRVKWIKKHIKKLS